MMRKAFGIAVACWLLYFRGRHVVRLLSTFQGYAQPLKDIVGNNQLVTGLLLPTITAYTWSTLRNIFDLVKSYLFTLFCAEVVVSRKNNCGYRLNNILTKRFASATSVRLIAKYKDTTDMVHQTRHLCDAASDVDIVASPMVSMVGDTWRKFVVYQGHLIMITLTPTEVVLSGHHTSLGMMEKYVYDAIHEELVDSQTQSTEHVIIKSQHTLHSWDVKWLPGTKTPLRPASTLFLRGDMFANLVQDIKTFQASHQWYANRGVPYRRGYLLHGPPGTGKTTTVHALASALGLSICTLKFTTDLTDSLLDSLIRALPKKAILLIEDIDACFPEPQLDPKTNTMVTKTRTLVRTCVTFDGLLNVMDGVSAPVGRILFITTNHVERLDPALIRSGRCDVRHEIGLATSDQVHGIVSNFYPDAPTKDVEAFVAKVPPKTVSPAAIQGHLFSHISGGVLDALRHVEDLIPKVPEDPADPAEPVEMGEVQLGTL